jgi:DNA-binding MarR family transcriptional regulator
MEKLTSQVIPQQALAAWISLLRSHSALTREMNTELVAKHGLTLSDYDVLVNLARAPERAMRRVDLAASVVLTASGITRLLDGLERAGWVCKRSCEVDARVTYAVLTDEGLEKLREASVTHHADIQRLFTIRFDDEELGRLGALLGKLYGDNGVEVDADACGPLE